MTEFALDINAAVACPVRTQNQFNPLLSPSRPRDPALIARAVEDQAHRVQVFAFLRTEHGSAVRDLSGHAEGSERAAATVAAMTEGVPIILGGQLPTDWAHHRSGAVDILLREGTTTNPAKRPAYNPALIRNYPIITASTERGDLLHIGSLAKPFRGQAEPEKCHHRIATQVSDLLPLAHLWCLLQASGFATHKAWAANVSLDHRHPNNCCAVVWTNLETRSLKTYAQRADPPWKFYSPLSRYQHEFRFLVRVADHARQQSASGPNPELVAAPVRIAECATCEWWPHCQSQLADDISVKIERSPLDVREIMRLRSLGISTVPDLVAADLDKLIEDYLPQVGHRAGGEDRLRLAAHRARLLEEGVDLERLSVGPIRLASAPVEIDLDIETDASNHAYLWGFLIDNPQEGFSRPWYRSFHRFADLTQRQELNLAEKAAEWLQAYVESLGDTPVLVWHYSNYEVATIRRFARARGKRASLGWLHDFAQDHFVDLLPIVRKNFFGFNGLGLKVVASAGAKFSWRDQDPSGLNSQLWSHEAIHSPSLQARRAAEKRILEYNEDDVRATWHLRRWLRQLP